MGTQLEQTRHNKTGEAKLNIMHMRQETVTIMTVKPDQPQENMGNTC